jgi:hypothetical protein
LTTDPSFNASALGLASHASASPSNQPLPTATTEPPPAATPQPLSALPTGQVIAGVGSSQPISLVTQADNGTYSASESGNNAQVTIDQFGVIQNVEARTGYADVRLDADVAFTGPDNDNNVGLGCADQQQSTIYQFTIRSDKTWTIQNAAGLLPTVIAHGTSTLIKPVQSANHLSVVCAISSGQTHLMFAINGVTVADQIVSSSSSTWFPMLVLCACNGPDSASYANLSEMAW